MDGMANDPLFIVGILLAVFMLFMAGREIANWYFKINRRVELQEETNRLLQKISDSLPKQD